MVHGRRGTYAKFDGSREVIEIFADLLLESITTGLVCGQVDEGGGNNTLLALYGLDNLDGEFSSGVSHGEGGRACAILCLHDFITTELDTVHKGIVGLLRNA